MATTPITLCVNYTQIVLNFQNTFLSLLIFYTFIGFHYFKMEDIEGAHGDEDDDYQKPPS